MIVPVSCSPRAIKTFTEFNIEVPGSSVPFPLLQLDRDSYIVGAEIQSGLNFNYDEGVHCIQLGKYCSLAEKITFLVNLNHDYKSVVQGNPSFLAEGAGRKLPRKGTVLIQNDVWLGHGVTVLSGVTIHNGAVAAADSVISRDVPEFAIVAGNPAEIIGYRFPEEQRKALLEIAWWNWDQSRLESCQDDFYLPAERFIEKHIGSARQDLNSVVPFIKNRNSKTVLFIPDFSRPYPLWKKILDQYFSLSLPSTELLIYLTHENTGRESVSALFEFLEKYSAADAAVTVLDGQEGDDERCLFASADYFITTRDPRTVRWTGFADLYNVKILYGTDEPLYR